MVVAHGVTRYSHISIVTEMCLNLSNFRTTRIVSGGSIHEARRVQKSAQLFPQNVPVGDKM